MDAKLFEMFKMMEAINTQNSQQSNYDYEGLEKIMQIFELKNALDNCENSLDVLFVVRDYLTPNQQRNIDILFKLMEVKDMLNGSNSAQNAHY